MTIQVEQLNSLEHKMSVEIPAEKIRELVDKQTKKLMTTARIPGFRVGKIPSKVIESRYGKEIFSEVVQETFSNSLKEAFEQKNLKPVSRPRIENFHAAPNESLRYEAFFDIYPTIQLADLGQTEVTKKVVRINDEDINATIEQLHKRESDWALVDRTSKNGDKVIADVTLESGDMPAKDMKKLPVELGSKTMIAGFEDGLVGSKAGDQLTLHLTFPDPYFDEKLSGKPAKFTIQVLEVLERKSISDEALLEKLGVEGGMDELRAEIRSHIEKEAQEALSLELKQDLWNKLLAIHSFDIPKSLVEAELHRIIHPNQPYDDTHHHDDASEEQKQNAERQVRLGLLISEFTEANHISVNNDQLRAKIEQMVSAYQNPSEMAEYYYRNKNVIAEIKARILEDQVVEEMLKRVKLVEKEIDYQELTKK